MEQPHTAEHYIKIINRDNLEKIIELDLCLKENGVPYSNKDLRAFFASEMLKAEEFYNTQESAIKAARRILTWRMAGYQYALKNGCKVDDEELQQRISEELEKVKSASEYSTLESVYEEYGTSYEECREYEKEKSRLRYTEEKLKEFAYEKYRHGDNPIGEKFCEYFNEYWNCFLLEVILPAEETYIHETLEPLLDEAETFYMEKCTEFTSLQ